MHDAPQENNEEPNAGAEERLAAALAGIGTWSLDLATDELRLDPVPGVENPTQRPDVVAIGRLLDRVHPDDRQELQRRLREAVESDSAAAVDVECRLLHAGATHTWLALRGRVLRDDTGKPVKLAGVHFDNTERKRAEQATLQATQSLEEANRAKDGFLAKVSHEIRTPLTSILGYAELLLQRTQGEHEPVEVSEILNSGRYLENLVDDLLDLSRISAGKVAIDPQPVEVLTLVHEIESTMAIRAADAGLTLASELESGVPEVILTDGLRVRQVLTNLIGNAIKFTPEGEVHLAVAPEQIGGTACVVFTVRDTGRGIDPDWLAHVFEPFHQEAQGESNRRGGLGLGLAISQRLATLLGGRLEAESRVGSGSSFRLILPAATIEAPDDRPAGTDPDTCASPSLRGRIIVADGTPALRRLLHEYLSRAGAEVVTRNNGRDLLAALEEAHRAARGFDAALVDLHMGDLDLPALFSLANERGTALAVLAMTTHATREDRQAYLDMGFQDVVTKPFSPAKLRARVSKALSDKRLAIAPKPAVARLGKVLVVEDHESLAELTANQLRDLGYDVEVAFSAAAAMDRARTLSPEAIVVDLSLPDMDGVELCRILHRDFAPGGCRVLAYTGSEDAGDHAALQAAGCVGVLVKPATKAQFRALLAPD
jgi:signal transduction histidine kinase/CheY-like chemotaxis protein